jgi:hypothetical protein
VEEGGGGVREAVGEGGTGESVGVSVADGEEVGVSVEAGVEVEEGAGDGEAVGELVGGSWVSVTVGVGEGKPLVREMPLALTIM